MQRHKETTEPRIAVINDLIVEFIYQIQLWHKMEVSMGALGGLATLEEFRNVETKANLYIRQNPAHL